MFAAPGRDIDAAEDALADALERALTHWHVDGIPANPRAWIRAVAHNRLRDLWKFAGHRLSDPLDGIDWAASEPVDKVTSVGEPGEASELPDRRLELMLVCAHPAIAERVRAPLMLQVVLGVDAAHIASAFGLEPATMAQRVVRAKKCIRDTGIPFVLPRREQLEERLPAVSEAAYAAYAIDWELLGSSRRSTPLPRRPGHLALTC